MRSGEPIYFLIVLLLLIGNPVHSHELEFGIKAGIVRSQAELLRDLPGIGWGAISEFSIGSHIAYFFLADQLGLQPEFHYSVKGFDVLETDRGREASSQYKVSYFEIPLLLTYRLPLRGKIKPGLVFGPYVGIAQKVKEVQTAFGASEERDLGDNLKNTDIGLILGGNVRYDLGAVRIVLSARYSIGLRNLSKNIQEIAYDFREDDTIRNRAFVLMIGMTFSPYKH